MKRDGEPTGCSRRAPFLKHPSPPKKPTEATPLSTRPVKQIRRREGKGELRKPEESGRKEPPTEPPKDTQVGKGKETEETDPPKDTKGKAINETEETEPPKDTNEDETKDGEESETKETEIDETQKRTDAGSPGGGEGNGNRAAAGNHTYDLRKHFVLFFVMLSVVCLFFDDKHHDILLFCEISIFFVGAFTITRYDESCFFMGLALVSTLVAATLTVDKKAPPHLKGYAFWSLSSPAVLVLYLPPIKKRLAPIKKKLCELWEACTTTNEPETTNEQGMAKGKKAKIHTDKDSYGHREC